jgi:hypothetical protein
LNADTTVNWAQLGTDGTLLGSTFTATPAGALTGVNTIGGSLSAVNSILAVDCAASPCSWGPVSVGFLAGQTLIWTSDAGSGGNGPLVLTFPAVYAAGLWMQADTGGAFTASITATYAGALTQTFTEASDASGDPIFIGERNGVANITKISLTLTTVGFGGNLNDFAVDRLLLNDTNQSTTPEPASVLLLGTGLAAFALRKRLSKAAKAAFPIKTGVPVLLACALAMFVCASAHAQGAIQVAPGSLRVLDDNHVVQKLHASGAAQAAFTPTGPPLPIFLYSVVAADANTYQGEMVGRSPFANGKRTTNIQMVLIPLIIKTELSSTTLVFNPQAADDGCLGAGHSAFGLTQNSAELNAPASPFVINGVTVGGLNFADAHLRAEFWSVVQPTGNAFHLGLPFITEPAQTLDLTAVVATNASTLHYTPVCGSNAGATNNSSHLGVVNINYLDPLLQGIIGTLGLTENQFPFFVLYRTVISDGAANNINNCCILGYHSSTTATAIGDPGQTYGIFEFDTGDVFSGIANTSVMAHETSEWVNDPGGSNLTPVWASGQSAICGNGGQNNLEVGDPLSGISNDHFITMPNSYTYRMQELAYFSWFYGADGIASLGAGTCAAAPASRTSSTTGGSGCFSTNGTFKGPAQYCPVGGTYPN